MEAGRGEERVTHHDVDGKWFTAGRGVYGVSLWSMAWQYSSRSSLLGC